MTSRASSGRENYQPLLKTTPDQLPNSRCFKIQRHSSPLSGRGTKRNKQTNMADMQVPLASLSLTHVNYVRQPSPLQELLQTNSISPAESRRPPLVHRGLPSPGPPSPLHRLRDSDLGDARG